MSVITEWAVWPPRPSCRFVVGGMGWSGVSWANLVPGPPSSSHASVGRVPAGLAWYRYISGADCPRPTARNHMLSKHSLSDTSFIVTEIPGSLYAGLYVIYIVNLLSL